MPSQKQNSKIQPKEPHTRIPETDQTRTWLTFISADKKDIADSVFAGEVVVA